MKRMVQYSVWPNCNNNCKFCLRKERDFYTLDEQLISIEAIKKNIEHIEWNNYPYGISLLGGELYSITNDLLQKKFLELIKIIIDKILIQDDLFPNAKYSSVTNGIYQPNFLFKVLDLIEQYVGMQKVDLNFSYDLKYRYKDDKDREQVLSNIKAVHNRYRYKVGVQMIVTQNLIQMIKNEKFNINSFIEKDIAGNELSLLYPHPINTGYILDDFKFKRRDLLWFLSYLRNNNMKTYSNFMYSTKNSGTFKYTGLSDKKNKIKYDYLQEPKLSDGKEILNDKCGHSMLYQCYEDSNKCLLCDLINFDNFIVV